MQSNYGIPYPIQSAKQLGMSFKVATFPSTILKGLLRAARAHGVKLYATQFATNLIACMRAALPPLTDSEHRVTLPFNAVDLRRLLSTLGQTELVSALGFNTLDARDLMRFRAAGEEGASERVILDAVWTLAREIQVQLNEQAEWDTDFVKSAPAVLGTIATWLKNEPYAYSTLFLASSSLFLPDRPQTDNATPQITNTGVLDCLVKSSYPVASRAPMKVLDVVLHNIIFHVAVHTYTWCGELHYSYSVPLVAGGAPAQTEVVGKWMQELERITMMAASDFKEECVLVQPKFVDLRMGEVNLKSSGEAERIY